MQARLSLLLSAVAAAALMNVSAASAQALSGTVTSTQEGAMEGVIVTAKKDGAHISISVVSNEKGQYSFPADRLEPGHYSLKIRATGYIDGDRPQADIVAGKTATTDLKLRYRQQCDPGCKYASVPNHGGGRLD